jgi:transposase
MLYFFRDDYLRWEEEDAFLERYKQQALMGQVATIREIKENLESRLGHRVHKTTVYRMLKRHGWRKVAPRPFHVKADREEQEVFKKTS